MAVNDQQMGSSEISDKPSDEPIEMQQMQQDNATLSDCVIKIIGCAKVENYEGEPAIVVGYTWINNSNETKAFEKAIESSVYQGGNKLSRTVLLNKYEQFDMDASYAEIATGETATVYQAFLLKNESDIIVRVENWYDFGSTDVIERMFKYPTEEQE